MERNEAINLTQGQQRPTTAGRGILRIVSPSELRHMEDEAAQRNKAEAEQQKPAILSLAQDLQTKFQAAVNARSDIELRLLQCRRQRSGKYDPDVAAKVKGFTFHSIRHHVLSLLNDSGKLSLKQVQMWARHKRQSTTENYLRSMRGLEEAIAVLEKSNESNAGEVRKQG